MRTPKQSILIAGHSQMPFEGENPSESYQVILRGIKNGRPISPTINNRVVKVGAL